MIPRKKLQVFVSSTYEDLKEERQAAVEAILRAKHIPAGMELFAAGDQSQMQTIREWIDESDVFLLILGGRYGTIEQESQKSYIQLEYEYARDQGKALFAVVITDSAIDRKVKEMGKRAIEQKHPAKLESFREIVCGKMVRYCNDVNEIKLAILEKLPGLNDRKDLIGWVPGDQAVNSGAVAEEIARQGKENAELRERLSELESSGVVANQLHFQSLEPRVGEVISNERLQEFQINFDLAAWINYSLPPMPSLTDLEEDAFLPRLADTLKHRGIRLSERSRRQALFKALGRLVSSSKPEQRERFLEALQSQIHDDSAKMLIIKSLAEQDGETLRNYARIGISFDVLNQAQDLADELKRRFTADD